MSEFRLEKNTFEKRNVTTPSCVICDAINTRFLCEVDDNHIWHCPECVSDFVWPMPDQQSLKTLYDRRGWFEGGERGGYEKYDEQTENLPIYLDEAIEIIEAGGTPKTILDIGCGYGTHLAVAADRGWQCFGVEVSEHARKIAKNRHGNSIYLVERVEELVPCQFDLILMLDVIEHLTNPYPLFYALFNIGAVGPETSIVITTPNAMSSDAVADPTKWVYRHPPSHLIYYSAQSLFFLLNQLKWNAVEITGLYSSDGLITSNNGTPPLNEKFKDYAGLLCTATGCDFSSFMHERYVPGTWNKIAKYEHIPRYEMAQKLAKDLKVLDFGCGTGYGTAMLAQEAEFVVGVDIAEDALKWARSHHRNSRIHFEQRDDLGAGLPEGSFDLITCFEMIEHVDQKTQELAIKSFRRITGAHGKLVISTPNPEITENYGENLYHLHEMKEEEFVSLLKVHFKHIQLLKQWIRPSVLIAPRSLFSIDGRVRASALGANGRFKEQPEVAYIAICSDTPFAEVEGVCNFDSSFDFVAKSISDINMLNRERIDKFNYFNRVRNNERTLSENMQSILALQELVNENASTIHTIQELVKEKESSIHSMQELVNEYESTIHTHNIKISQQETTIENLHSALISNEKKLDAFRRYGITELLYVLEDSTNFPKKIIKGLKVFLKVLAPQSFINKLSYIKQAVRKNLQAIDISTKTFDPYEVRVLYPLKKRRPKVVHVLANFMTGGSSQLVVDLIERLGHCYEQEVVTSYNPDPPSYVGFPIKEIQNKGNPEILLNYFIEFRPELVHIHYWGDVDEPWYKQAFLAAERYGCKIIENVNTPVIPFLSENISKYVYVSDYVLNTFGENNAKSHTIYPGSNFDIFKRGLENNIPDDCIGMVYRLEPDKLNEQSIDTFIEVVKRRPTTKVLIVGGGTFLEPYKEAARVAGVLNSFIFTGFVSYKDLPALYSQMSLFVAPVWKESFGQVTPFAMSMGIPVVGYNIGALSEIIADKTLLAPSGDSNRLAEIIIELLNDREKRIEIGVQNRNRAHISFSVEAMIEGYKSLYDNLLSEKK